MSNVIISTSLSRGNDTGYTENIVNIFYISSFIPALCITVYMLITQRTIIEFRILSVIHHIFSIQIIECPNQGLSNGTHSQTERKWLDGHSKGTVAGDGFFAHSIMSRKVVMDLKICWLWSKIRRDRFSFMSIGVFSIYDKMILAYSPHTFIFFKRSLCGR